jgi:hypothetical protein
MAFSKSFPKKSDKSVYPKWDEVTLTKEEEISVEEECRQENMQLMRECLKDAKHILADSKMNDQQSDAVNIAIALFEKRSSHAIYWKENKAKAKFASRENEESE